VHVLYQENDWVYVISEDSREGFIPHSYTAQFGSQVCPLYTFLLELQSRIRIRIILVKLNPAGIHEE
jgi:hypothetical protein